MLRCLWIIIKWKIENRRGSANTLRQLYLCPIARTRSVKFMAANESGLIPSTRIRCELNDLTTRVTCLWLCADNRNLHGETWIYKNEIFRKYSLLLILLILQFIVILDSSYVAIQWSLFSNSTSISSYFPTYYFSIYCCFSISLLYRVSIYASFDYVSLRVHSSSKLRNENEKYNNLSIKPGNNLLQSNVIRWKSRVRSAQILTSAVP